MKVKKLDTPDFSGKIRDYPSFKRDYERHMIPAYGEDPFALKKCLSAEALYAVRGVDDDFKEMFRRLDLKYGRPEKLSDAVLCELKGLKPVKDGEHREFVSMVDVVDNCWLDLKKMDLEREMDTSTMVSQIERLLPSVQKREWALQKQRPSPKSQVFNFLLDFLLQEKQAMEYINADMRETEQRCQRGKAHSSTVEECPSEDSKPTVQDQLNRQGEMLEQVVQGLTQVAQVLTGTRVRGGLLDSQRKSEASKARCWFHGTDTHDIDRCNGFGQLAPKDRLDCVRKNGGCFGCLKQGHISSRCLDDRKICGLDGCTQSHHPLLHQSLSPVSTLSCHNATNLVNERSAGDGVILLMVSSVKCKE